MKLPTFSSDFISQKLTLVLLSTLLVACSSGGGSEEGEGTVPQSTDNISPQVETNEIIGGLDNDGTWSLEDKLFISGGELSRTQSNQVDRVTIVVGDEVFGNSNGVYSGGSIRIVLTLTGSGVYSVTDSDNFEAAVGSGAKAATINVTAGTLSNNETQWATTAASGTVTVVVNTEGRYFVSTNEPLILTRKIDIGTGVPGSPDQVLFRMRSINGVLIQ